VSAATSCPAFLNQEYRKLHSSDSVNLCTLVAGKPILIVNTASHCGFTPQFKGLEAAYQKYKARGLVVVGFSSDDFDQEAKDEAEAATICFINYGVKFTMLAPQHVKGPEANAVFKELARQTQEPQWNFNKYLVAADGVVVEYFDSRVEPDSQQFSEAVEKLLE
jgi:glutathione peroxidase